ATRVSSAVSWTDAYVDGNYLSSGPPFTKRWDSRATRNGRHRISVKAFNAHNQVIGWSSVKVDVMNVDPTPTPTPDPTPSATPTGDPTPTITGTAYYVDSIAGRDSNAGTSSAAPWQTIRRVMDEL